MIPEYVCDLDPATKTKLKVVLIKNVKNVEEIRSKVISGAWRCCVVKPSLVVSPLQLAAAANRAALSRLHGNMVTRTVYGEILYNLSLTKNISQSLAKFGIEKEQDLLVCFLITSEEDFSADIVEQIDGDISPMSELTSLTNIKDVKSVYKLNNLKDDVDLLDVIVSRMATKTFVSH
ncbi:EKC/KEOPS complex subunit Tprkb-like [Pectinophora gossypiella]|uniref:Uncharacterized protein n=1 Tax=Pectinophora gossypiella TaxID=13191 RepID=A0A1E1WBE8_PECGO|nr:EKC/KEOPS complex subunit Tprkb-like [Pectinophora gossypiella]